VLAAYYKIRQARCRTWPIASKMAKTSSVIVIVEAAAKLYSATKEVKVTVGGCGGAHDPKKWDRFSDKVMRQNMS